MTPKIGRIEIHLDNPHYGSIFIANLADVDARMKSHNRRSLISWVKEYWPEIWKKEGAAQFIKSQPSYILAIMLEQL